MDRDCKNGLTKKKITASVGTYRFWWERSRLLVGESIKRNTVIGRVPLSPNFEVLAKT